MKLLSDCQLYTFIDTAYLHGRDPTVIARALCEGGSDVIQLRAKDVPADRVREMARAILPITRAANVGLVINDFPEIAKEVGADLCHLGQEDYFEDGKRSSIPFGLSSHSPDQALRAIATRPAYVAIGPVYATATKPGAKPVTLDYVRWAAANVTLPWFAIGGITLQNVDDVLKAGAQRICVVSAILNQADVRQACQAFQQHLLSAAPD
ncbi:MAG: thiamine phosphate synthase [Verrucomicrobia subdivision 3 bacterium]|nr:thiamine phosphate synthase [Limisphaerales bacterium]